MSADELVSEAIDRIESGLYYELSNTTVKHYNQVMRRWELVKASLLCASGSCASADCAGPETHLERLDYVG